MVELSMRVVKPRVIAIATFLACQKCLDAAALCCRAAASVCLKLHLPPAYKQRRAFFFFFRVHKGLLCHCEFSRLEGWDLSSDESQ